MTIFTICAAFYAYYKMCCCYSSMFPLIHVLNCVLWWWPFWIFNPFKNLNFTGDQSNLIIDYGTKLNFGKISIS